MLEIALTLGRLVATHAAKAWLGDRRKKVERTASLTDLTLPGAADGFTRRKLSRQLEDIGDRVAQRLEPALHTELRGLPDNERQAALDAVIDTLCDVDLTDTLLLSADLDPAELVRRIRAEVPDATRRAGLSADAVALFDLVLLETCACLVSVITQLPAFQPRALTELLSRVGDLADSVGEVLNRLPRPSLTAPDGTTLDDDFARRYLGFLSEALDELEMFGIDVRRYRPRTSVSVAYLSLTVSGAAPKEEWLSILDHQRTEGIRVEQALAGSRRTLLRGTAGSGKTTLLQWIAVTASRAGFTGPLAPWNGKVPFLVRLRSFADGNLPQPAGLIAAAAAPIADFEPTAWAARQFVDGRAVLLIDGVDELRADRRSRVRRWLSELLVAYPHTEVVVTSRPAAAKPRWLTELGFQTLDLEPMTPADIAEFTQRWHAAVRQTGGLPCPVEELGEYEAALLRQLEGNRHLRALAATPLLCAMLCALNLDRRKHLPPDRMHLYAAALDLLLERRDVEREIPSEILLSGSAKVTILQYLAWWLTLCARSEAKVEEAVHQIGAAIRRVPGAQGIEAGEMLEHLLERSGVLREPVPGRVDFVHRTFQEYLAGKYAAEEHYGEVLVRNAHLEQWRETVIMGVGHAAVPVRREIINAILDRAAAEPRHSRKLRLVAAGCMETAHTLDEDTAARLDTALETLFPPKRSVEARSLSTLGDRTLRHLPHDLSSVSAASAAACVRSAVLVGSPQALRLLGRYALDPRTQVQQALASGWNFANPEHYAKEVLANAPLSSGHILIESATHVQYLSVLQHLKSFTVNIFGHRADLSFLSVDDRLTALVLGQVDYPDIDLSPLRQMAHLQEIVLLGDTGKGITGLNTLRALTRLNMLRLTTPRTRKMEFISTLSELVYLGIHDAPGLKDVSTAMSLPKLENLTLWGSSNPNFGRSESPSIQVLTFDKNVDLKSTLPLFPNIRILSLWLDEEGQDITPVQRVRTLEELNLIGHHGRVDLTPLTVLDQPVTITLHGVEATGLDKLGPNITVTGGPQ
ncbi:NACHT domain-containing protein [Actinokineospora spheciospongiae]|uniref:NACHT domain-containing protein n=1 Tax=Actinokineospora spheciospongiae TaxID=909613 RepID=UPI0005565A86|nr:NACHT domain-containing protein [Actinokineospora spheciospongiae]